MAFIAQLIAGGLVQVACPVPPRLSRAPGAHPADVCYVMRDRPRRLVHIV